MRSLLFVLVLLMGCGTRTPTSIEIDPALTRLVPADAVALSGVKVDALRTKPLFQKWIAPRLDESSKDVSEVLLISKGKEAIALAKRKGSVVPLGSKNLPAAGGGIPATLREKLRSIPPEAQIWAVGIGSTALPVVIPKQGNLANLQNLLSSLQSWTAYADLRTGLKMEASAVYSDEASAKQIHDALRGLIGLGRLSTPDNAPEMLQLYDSVQVSMQKNVVRVTANISDGVLEKALARMGSRQR